VREDNLELIAYFRILMKKWQIVVAAFLITLISTIIFTFTQTPIYKATATFVIAPAGKFDDRWQIVSGVDALSRQSEIASTYGEVAISDLIKQEAADTLNLSAQQAKTLQVHSKRRAGTNVLEITVEGPNPVLVGDFANATGDRTLNYIAKLYEVYDMKPLDLATPPAAPISPDTKLNLALGITLGLVLGCGLSLFATYLQTPLKV
jgi:capsular polysaccharide biosynthesis protein